MVTASVELSTLLTPGTFPNKELDLLQVRLNPKRLPVLGTQFTLEFGSTSTASVVPTRSADKVLSILFDFESLFVVAHPEAINKKARRLNILYFVINRNLTFQISW